MGKSGGIFQESDTAKISDTISKVGTGSWHTVDGVLKRIPPQNIYVAQSCHWIATGTRAALVKRAWTESNTAYRGIFPINGEKIYWCHISNAQHVPHSHV